MLQPLATHNAQIGGGEGLRRLSFPLPWLQLKAWAEPRPNCASKTGSTQKRQSKKQEWTQIELYIISAFLLFKKTG